MGKTYQSIVINVPVAKVWEKISDFHNLSWATGVIEKCEPVGKMKGNQVWAQRILNDAFHETLLELSQLSGTIKYSIDDSPSPVSKNEVQQYIGAIRIAPITEDNATFVE